MALIVDQLRAWVPDICFYILACVLVLVASADSVFISNITRDAAAVAWPLKVCFFFFFTLATGPSRS